MYKFSPSECETLWKLVTGNSPPLLDLEPLRDKLKHIIAIEAERYTKYKDMLKNSTPIPGFSRYLLLEDNRVFNLNDNTIKIFTIDSRTGYARSAMINDLGKSRSVALHRIIATIRIPNPNNLPEVNHLDGDKTNNSVHNLEWCTYQRNMYHALDNRLNRCRKPVRCIETGETFVSINAAAKSTGKCTSALSNHLCGKTSNFAQKHWEYIK